MESSSQKHQLQGRNNSHHKCKYYTCNGLLEPCESEDTTILAHTAKLVEDHSVKEHFFVQHQLSLLLPPMFARVLVIFVPEKETAVSFFPFLLYTFNNH